MSGNRNRRAHLSSRTSAPSGPHDSGYTLSPEHCTIQHIQQAVSGLKADQVPDRYAQSWDDDAESAAFACLGTLIKAVPISQQKPPSFKKALVDGIVEANEGICGWTLLLTERLADNSSPEKARRQYLLQASFLQIMISLDPRVTYSFLETHAFVEILCILWTAQDPTASRELSFIIDLENQQGDSILSLIHSISYAVFARDILIENVLAKNVIMFAAATTGRAVQIRDVLRTTQYSPAIIPYVKNLVEFLGRIMTHPSTELRSALVSSECFTQFGHLFYELALVLKRSPLHRGSLKQLAQPIYHMAVTLAGETRRTARNWAELISGKFEPALAFITMSLSPRDTDEKRMVTEALLEMGNYTIFPSVLKQLLKARANQNTEDLVRAQHISDVGLHWKEFWMSTFGRAKLYEDWSETGMLDICDNPLCDHRDRAPGSKSRQCSRCSSVVYCSKSCQRIDWSAHHHSECDHARSDHIEQRDSGRLYSHACRAFHLKHLEAIYTKHFDQIERTRGAADPSTFVLVTDCTTAKDRIEVYRIKNKDPTIWQNTTDLQFTQDYLSKRLKALGDEYASGSMGQDVRVIEGAFPNGSDSEIYLPVLLKKVGDRFKAVYSIPRRGMKIPNTDS